VTNAGPSFASNVVLTDSFPAGAPTALFSYQGSLSVAPPGSGNCAEPAPGATSGTLTCTFPGLASGESVTVTYAMRAESIASGVSGTVFNTASATADETETLPANNQTEHATTTRRTADLAVAKSAPGTLTPGVPFAWTITITNHGPNDSSGAVLTDALPAGVAFQGASPGCAFAAGTVTCTLGALPSGASIPVTIDVLPSSPYTGANPLSNTATVVTVNEVDPVPTNDSATATIVPGSAVADLSLAKIGPASVLPGAPVRWQLVIANAGPSAAHGTTFSDPLPAGAAGAIASCSGATGGAACGPVGVAGGIVSGTIATLPPGGTLTVIIDATAPPAGALVNTASVTPPVGAADPQPADNTATASTTITALPDLVVAVTASGPFARGQTGATYALLVTNTGAGATTAPVSVDHALPAGLTATAIAGAGWTCTLATLGCTRSDALAAGASFAPITLTVDVALDAPATLVNVASVSGGGESNASNNQATATTNLAPASSPAEAIPALSWASLLGLAALVAAFARRRGLR
jgi:uncharacterized repeat protein (TIGR01451 family)